MLREPSYIDEQIKETRISSSYMGSLRLLFPFLTPYKKSITIALLAIIIAALTVLGLGFGLRFTIDYGFSQNQSFWLGLGVIILLSVVIIMAGASYTRLLLISKLSERIIVDLRCKIFKRLLNQKMVFFETMNLGEIQSRLTTDTVLLQIIIGTSVPIAIRNLLIIAGGLVMLMITSLTLTLLICLLIPIVLIPILVYGKYIKQYSQKAQAKTAKISTQLDETFSLIRTILTFCRESFVIEQFEKKVEEAYSVSLQRIKAKSLMTALVMILVFSGISFVLWFGGHSVLAGEMTVGQLSAFLFYALAVAGSAGSLSEIHGDLLRAAGATERIFEFLALPLPETTLPKSLPTLKGNICFKNVSFSYPSRPNDIVLKQVSFEITEGETIAFVGPSGAGKTTIFNLILQFYTPLKGQIKIDNIDFSKVDNKWLRESIGVVPQDPGIFTTSIMENIRFGRLEATNDEVIKASQIAYADNFIAKLPKGYHTHVGEKGVKLSGGQRQRIALARAILKNPKILLLDEATSSLDAESEKFIQKALEEMKEYCTTLIIAHRLSTIQKANRILVLNHGEIVEVGTHKELIKQQGIYQRLVSLQLQ